MERPHSRHIGDILAPLLKKWEKNTVKRISGVMEAWYNAAGKGSPGHSRPVAFKNGIITILVENSSWLYKYTVEKKGLLERFNSMYGGRKKATDIRFRIGEIEE